ncbi:MAG: efflux RND transporter permease subunit [Rhodothermales bacterium]
MRLTDTAITYRTSILVLTAVLTIGGLFSYVSIPKESSPSIEIPQIVVTTVYPGASPDDVESLITQHIEKEVQNVTGIKDIRSTSTEGVSTIVIEFEPDVSIDDAYSKVRDKVDVARSELPSDVEEPVVSEIDFSQFPIMTVNLAAPYSLTRLKEVAEQLEDDLESIPSVLEVDVLGALEREVKIDVDLNRLQGYNLTFNDLVTAISNENINLPGGSIDVDDVNYLVRVDGVYQDPAGISDIVIKAPGGQPIFVRDVATVDFGFQKRTSYSRLSIRQVQNEDGSLTQYSEERQAMQPVISLNVKKRSGENILETVDAVRTILDGFTFPSGTEVIVTGDQSEDVRDLITDLENNIISGLIFVVVVLLFFLGVRNAVLVGIAIPLSMLLTFSVLQVLGYTLNFVILFSMIIALGMLVDNAIVIVENIYRFREEGHSKFEAARLGTKEVAGAVVASTATTVAVFVPMLFWPGIIGEFMSYMPLTLIIALVCSLFVALIINPVFTGIFIRLDGEAAPERPPLAKRLTLGIVVFLAILLAATNWKTLLVLGVGAPLVYVLHVRIFKKIGDNFVKTRLPALVDIYRNFLTWMLVRDYSAPRALLRNSFSLGSFTLGFVLLLLGGIASGPLGTTAASVFLMPGGLLLIAGLLGVLVHTAESVILGRMGSVRFGLGFAIVSLSVLGLMSLSEKEVALATIVELVMFPVLVVIGGLLGHLFVQRERFILTDNRARLLNGSIGTLVIIVFMFVLAPTGVEFFPNTSPSQIQVTVEGPLGMNLEASNRVAEEARNRVESLLASHKPSGDNVKNMLVNVGVSSDAAFGGGAASPERSRITMNLVDYKDRPEDSFDTLDRIRNELQGIPGTEITIDKNQDGPPTGAPVNIEITGPDFEVIGRITRDVRQRLQEASESGSIPGLVDVKDNLNEGRPEVRVEIDRERAARFSLNTRMIASQVRAAINGVEAGKYRDGENDYDIVVRLREEDRSAIENLQSLTVFEEGVQVPLVAVADIRMSGGLGAITRLDLQRVATVTGEAAPGFNGQAILQQVQTLLAEYEAEMPPEYSMAYTGENEEQQESFGFLSVVLLVGVSLVFMIMVAQFNQVAAPFIIMVAVGFSLIGVMLGLILTRTPFGLMTFIGVISLAGIVVNNNIVLVDYAMQLRKRGMAKQQAIVEAGATRLRPVLLTAMTTVLGLIPLTFGINIDFVGLLVNLDPALQFGSENTQFWGPMGTAIISGLTFATFLTLVIVPVMYSVFDSVAARLSTALKPVGSE